MQWGSFLAGRLGVLHLYLISKNDNYSDAWCLAGNKYDCYMFKTLQWLLFLAVRLDSQTTTANFFSLFSHVL